MIHYRHLSATLCLYLCLVIRVNSQSDDSVCDESKCPGPIAYYKSVNCSPIYDSDDSCCPIAYDCDHLKTRSTTKCYVNGRAYEIGEKLSEDDANPCDIDCTCRAGYDGIATFNCAVVDCFAGPITPGCYQKNSPLNCCPGKEVCPENPEDRATCVVDGKEYKDGEYFVVDSDPSLNCVCQPGYTGENIEPFCAAPKRPYCDPEFRHASDIYRNCAPVYYSTQNPATDCSVFSRCQNSNDTVVPHESGSGSNSTSLPDMVCIFGNLMMERGDELNSATDYNSVCVKCVCDIPPVPTCQRLPDDKCDVTNHPPFE